MMKRFFITTQIFLLVYLLLLGCLQKKPDKKDGITMIDVVNNLGNYQAVSISEILSELEYIPLETNDDCFVGENIHQVIVTATHIFVSGSNFCYSFNRNGRFLSRIGHVGQGPGEYSTIAGLSINEKNQLIYIETTRNILEYSWDGVFRKSINKPQKMDEDYIQRTSFLRDNLFIGHAVNRSGNEMYNFYLFNDSGIVIKTFDNYLKFERTLYGLVRSMRPFRVAQHTYVKELSNDTLYLLNEQDELISHFFFNLGKYTYSKNMKEGSIDNRDNALVIPDQWYPMIGTPNYIFFSVMRWGTVNFPLPKGNKQTLNVYGAFSAPSVEVEIALPLGVYDIIKKTTRLLDTDPISKMLGFINDLDGGLSFWPKYYTSDNELVDVLQAFEMKGFLTEKYFAAHKIKNPQAHHKLKELLKDLDWDDNPVIVIAR